LTKYGNEILMVHYFHEQIYFTVVGVDLLNKKSSISLKCILSTCVIRLNDIVTLKINLHIFLR